MNIKSMKHLIKLTVFLLSAIVYINLYTPVAAQATTSFNGPLTTVADSNDEACQGLGQLGGTRCQSQGGNPEGKIDNLASKIVKLISYIAGIIAIIMVIIAGVRYTTSGGDSAKVGAAKSALIYALIGVAILALAQFLVHFVLTNTS